MYALNHFLLTFTLPTGSHNPKNLIPGEIFDAVFMGILVLWVLSIAWVNYGPNGVQRRSNAK